MPAGQAPARVNPTASTARKAETVSNRTERREIERLIVAEYKSLIECLRERGESLSSDWARWGEGARLTSARFHALQGVADALGMGRYDYDRCKRVIDGTQYSHQRI